MRLKNRKLNKHNLQTLPDCEQAGKHLLKDFPKAKPFVNLAFTENGHKVVKVSWTWDEDAYDQQKHYEHSTYTNPLKAVEFFKKTGVDCLAISYGTKHGAVKGENVCLRKEIVIVVAENLKHEGIFGVLVSHGSSVVPQYIVEEINQLGGKISQAHGIPLDELKSVIQSGIGKINVATDIRLAVTRNIREYFARNSEKRGSSPVKAVSAIWKLMERRSEQFDSRTYLTPIMENLILGEGKDFAGKGSIRDIRNIRNILARVKSGVREVVGSLIVEFGTVGHAAQVEVVSLDEMADRYRRMPTC